MLVVAKHDYPKGTVITDPEEMFELREFLEKDAPQAAFLDFDAGSRGMMRGSILTSDIHVGQPLSLISLESPRTKALKELKAKLGRPDSGRMFLPISTAQPREDSIRVGTHVDVIQSKSKDDPNGKARILLHDISVRAVIPADKYYQEMLAKQGKTNLVALRVYVDISEVDGQLFLASIKESESPSFLEVQPIGDAKKVDEKNSPKGP
jgi:hypothetical protein